MGKSHKKLRPDKTEALHKQYDAYIEADKKRKERNEYILWKMNDMRSLSYANHLQPQINHSDYRHKYFSIPLFSGIQPCASSQVNTLCKHNVCDEQVLREISKDFILIPKTHRYNFKGNFNLSNSEQNADWRNKYKILDKLKQMEKENIDVPVRDESNLDAKTDLAEPQATLENKIETKPSKSEIYVYKQEQATEIIYGIPVDYEDKRELAKSYCIDTVLLTPQIAVHDSGKVIQKDGVFSIKPKEQTKQVYYSVQPQQQNTISQPTIQTNKEPYLPANVVANFKENPVDNGYGIEPIEIINVIPHVDVELKDKVNTNPVYERPEVAAVLSDTVTQHGLDSVIEPNQSVEDPNAESELEAESRMFYQEHPLDQNSSNIDYAQNLQENQQDEYNVHYEQQLAETTSVGEFDETNQKYDPSYEQQYNPPAQQYNNTEAYVEQPTEYMQVKNAANDYSQSQYYTVDDQQQSSYCEPQQPNTDQQQSYRDPQQSYVDPQQYVADPQQPLADPQQSFADQQQSFAHPQQSYADHQLSVADPQQSIAHPQESYADQQQYVADPQHSFTDQQQSYADQQQSYVDQQQSYADQQQYVADPQHSFTDQHQYYTNHQESYSDQQQSYTHPQQSGADQQQSFVEQQEPSALYDVAEGLGVTGQQSFAEYTLESDVHNQEGFIAYNANEIYNETPLVQEYDTQMVQQIEPEQGYIVSEEGYHVGSEVYGTELPENEKTERLENTLPTDQISPVVAKELATK